MGKKIMVAFTLIALLFSGCSREKDTGSDYRRSDDYRSKLYWWWMGHNGKSDTRYFNEVRT